MPEPARPPAGSRAGNQQHSAVHPSRFWVLGACRKFKKTQNANRERRRRTVNDAASFGPEVGLRPAAIVIAATGDEASLMCPVLAPAREAAESTRAPSGRAEGRLFPRDGRATRHELPRSRRHITKGPGHFVPRRSEEPSNHGTSECSATRLGGVSCRTHAASVLRSCCVSALENAQPDPR